MDILLVMLAGMAVGRWLFPARAKRVNERVALACTLTLIFAMGVMLVGDRQLFAVFAAHAGVHRGGVPAQ